MPQQLNFKEAKARHLQFKSRLRAILYGDVAENENPVLSQYECPVGKWIYSEALANYDHIPEVQQLESVHADLHVVARKLVNLYKSGEIDIAQKGLTEIEHIADNLMSVLDKVEEKVVSADMTSVPAKNEDTELLLKNLLKENQLLDQKIKRQADDLQEQSDFYHKLLSVSPSVLWMTNEKAENIYINETWFNWSGLLYVNGISAEWIENIHEEDRERIVKYFKAHFDSRQKFELQYRMPEKDGFIRHCLVTGQPYNGKENEFAGFTGAIIDITKRVAAEAIIEGKAKNEMELLHNFFMQAPAILSILKGPQHIFELANSSYKELFGNREVLGLPVREALPELEGQGFFELLDDVFKNNKPYIGNEIPLTLDKGEGKELHHLNFIYQPFLNSMHETEGIMVFAYDVTELVMAKTLIQKSEEELRDVIQSAPFPIGVYIGNDFIIKLANQSIIDVYGKGQDVIGKSYKDLLPELEDQEIIMQMNEVYRTGVAFHAKDINVNLEHEGKTIAYYFNYSFTPLINKEGNVYGIINTAADVTEINLARAAIERSEKKFRGMADFLPQFVWTADDKGNLNYYNQAIYTYSGHNQKSLEDAGWLSIVHPDERDQNVQLWTESVTSGREFNFEHRFKKSGGEYRWQQSKAVPLKDESGNVLSWLGISSDIQNQKNLAGQLEHMVNERTELLRKANYDLERSNHELSQFAFVASHDLQEPLRKIITFVNRMKETQAHLPDNAQTYLTKIDMSAKRMSNLISDVLEFSTTVKYEHDKAETNLGDILHDILADFEIEIQEKQVNVKMIKLPVVKAIASQMRQLFHNLLSNSFKFARPEVPLTISISADKIMASALPEQYAANTSNEYFKISFSDNGIGFDQKYGDLIFTIFQRLHSKAAYEGTGIGLALCKRIMDNHNGFIFAESKENSGATFYIYLPVV